jgi:hypothetical protein
MQNGVRCHPWGWPFRLNIARVVLPGQISRCANPDLESEGFAVKHPISAAVTGVLLGIVLSSCRQGSPTSPAEGPVTPSDVPGYWAEYQRITTRDFIDGSGVEVKDTSTLSYADDYTTVLLFDTAAFQWIRWTNNRYCYEVEAPTPYTIDGGEFTADLFAGQQVNGTDTLNFTSTIGKAGDDLVITTTFLGTWYGGNPMRMDYEYRYSRPPQFPPAHWPQIECP